ncbi:MAG: lactate utilization protein [archaeon]
MESKWEKMPGEKTINETMENIRARGIDVTMVETRKDALDKIKELIPKGSEVMNGSSTTLMDIGFVDYLKSGKHGWTNLQEEILKEKDWPKQLDLRRGATTAEYFLGSVNAIAKTGELVACDASGSRVGAYLFSAKNLVLVSGAQKITGSLEDAMKRVREYVFPLEDQRARKAYGMGSATGKWVIMEKEGAPNRVKLILVKEKLGY